GYSWLTSFLALLSAPTWTAHKAIFFLPGKIRRLLPQAVVCRRNTSSTCRSAVRVHENDKKDSAAHRMIRFAIMKSKDHKTLRFNLQSGRRRVRLRWPASQKRLSTPK